MRRFVAFGPAIVVLLSAVVTIIAAPAAVKRISWAAAESRVEAARAALDEDDLLARIDGAVRNIADAVGPSVVYISVNRNDRRTADSQGSGWVYDAGGHVVTNSHVIRGANSIQVQFVDGRVEDAELVAVDSNTDIAVIRVRNSDAGLIPARRASSVKPRQGDRVFAFGAPFGFKFSMSEGIVSGLNRDPARVIGMGGYTNFIQTDAAVNPGNSGGPLVDVRGRVVGMNVAIATGVQPGGENAGQGQNSGISFAIPLSTIESVVDQLVDKGFVSRGFLGVELPSERENRRQLARLGFTGAGVYLSRVTGDGPAARAGARAGDVVLAINGSRAPNIAALRQQITINRAGEAVELVVWREGQELELLVQLDDLALQTPGLRRARNTLAQFGIMRLQESEAGLVVVSVRDGSDADRAGFRDGLVITSVGDQDVGSVDQFVANLSASGFMNGQPVEATIFDPRTRDEFKRELRFTP